ncbi:MAG: hypothetical protein WAV79_01510, partial [Anaerolineae bacterium]
DCCPAVAPADCCPRRLAVARLALALPDARLARPDLASGANHWPMMAVDSGLRGARRCVQVRECQARGFLWLL